jgi:hypothetical protein
MLRFQLQELGETPRVWKQVPGFVIRNCSPDLIESVVEHMKTHFVNVEAFCRLDFKLLFTQLYI